MTRAFAIVGLLVVAPFATHLSAQTPAIEGRIMLGSAGVPEVTVEVIELDRKSVV